MKTSYKNFDEYYSLRAEVLGLQNAYNDTVFKVIKKYLSDCNTILDVGCGRGMFLAPLERIGKKVVGLDYCDSNVELLKKYGYEAYKCDCVDDIPYRDKYDAVICAEVLEHLSQPEGEKLLGNIHRSIKDNGKLIVMVPFKERYDKKMVICPHCNKQFHRDGHVRNYTDLSELISELQSQGYSYLKHQLFMVQFPLSRRIPLIGHKLLHAIWPDRQADLVALFEKR